MEEMPKRGRGKPLREPYKPQLFTLSLRSLSALSQLATLRDRKMSNLVEEMILREAKDAGIEIEE